jgi:hypothetical protein
MNMIIVVFCIGLGLFLMIFGYNMGTGNFIKPGPGLMPFLLGASFVLLSFPIGYLELVASRSRKQTGDTPVEEDKKENVSHKKQAMVIGSLILYGLLMGKLGFLIATFLLLASLFWILGVKRIGALGGSFVTVLALYILFAYLGMRLPHGVLRLVGL